MAGEHRAEDGTETAETPDAAPAASGTLVAYYSRADENYADGGREWLEVGHTKVMAGYIAEALGADTYEIVPTQAYPEGYDDCCDQALEEQRNDARPAIAEALPDVSAYDVVFIGCPIWWGDEPMIVRTFLDGVDLSGKTIVLITHNSAFTAIADRVIRVREGKASEVFTNAHPASADTLEW